MTKEALELLEEFKDLNSKVILLRDKINDKKYIRKVGFNMNNFQKVKLMALQICTFNQLQIMNLEGFMDNDKCELYYNGELVYSEEDHKAEVLGNK